MKWDVIIIGGGAAGLFCAMEAGRRGRTVLVVEHNDEVGRKILISGFGYRVARQFNLKIIPPAPALVPLTLNAQDLAVFTPLSGVSIPAVVRCEGAEFAESILLTHRGMSGPAILQISSYWSRGKTLSVELLPGKNAHEMLAKMRESDAELATLLGFHIPKRFAQTWCDLYAPSKPLRGYSETEIGVIAERLHNWQVTPVGTEGFQKAEVTKGGLDTGELSSKTMEARRVPGLYFIGEVVDVTGQLGGYNFQWAWASGFAAGQYV
ncbi:MAG: NAD(P)/FAD-dependent oxidoreductase [Acidobacteria bacterium]|nr:NAD(P)/FAD-dependent oxidoreductase [Acidobacteriota bacterium]